MIGVQTLFDTVRAVIDSHGGPPYNSGSKWGKVEGSGSGLLGSQYLFSGTYEHSLDDKGRLTIPSSFRKDFAEGVVLRKYRDGSVEILPRAAWDLHIAKFQAVPRTDVRAQRFITMELAAAVGTELDKQGRVLLTQDLKAHGQLTAGPVVVTGALDRLKVWSSERWAQLQAEAETEDLDGYMHATYQV